MTHFFKSSLKVNHLFRVFLFLIVISSLTVNAQKSPNFFEDDTIFNKKRTILSSAIIGGGSIGSIAALSLVWYKNIPKSSFHFFDDHKEWLQIDKAGHVYTGWFLSKTTYEMYQWSGVDHKKATLIGGLYGFSYLLAFEVLDGFSTDWGFSWYDVSSNAIGSGLFMGQSYLWGQQKIKMKFSAHLTSYAQYRPNVLGSSFSERILKDYNGQTYWLSMSPGQFVTEGKFPKWLCFSLGYGAEGMIYGQESEPYVPVIDGKSIQFDRFRTLAFSLDIDLEEIPVKKPWLKRVFGILNKIKIPFPALILGDGRLRGSWLYF